MLLDRLLDNIGIGVEPFAICHVHRGWRLEMTGVGEVHLHFVVEGHGAVAAGANFRARVGFSSRSHFSTASKATFGRDPAGFRADP